MSRKRDAAPGDGRTTVLAPLLYIAVVLSATVAFFSAAGRDGSLPAGLPAESGREDSAAAVRTRRLGWEREPTIAPAPDDAGSVSDEPLLFFADRSGRRLFPVVDVIGARSTSHASVSAARGGYRLRADAPGPVTVIARSRASGATARFSLVLPLPESRTLVIEKELEQVVVRVVDVDGAPAAGTLRVRSRPRRRFPSDPRVATAIIESTAALESPRSAREAVQPAGDPEAIEIEGPRARLTRPRGASLLVEVDADGGRWRGWIGPGESSRTVRLRPPHHVDVEITLDGHPARAGCRLAAFAMSGELIDDWCGEVEDGGRVVLDVAASPLAEVFVLRAPAPHDELLSVVEIPEERLSDFASEVQVDGRTRLELTGGKPVTWSADLGAAAGPQQLAAWFRSQADRRIFLETVSLSGDGTFDGPSRLADDRIEITTTWTGAELALEKDAGRRALTLGDVRRVAGRVEDESGRPVGGALVAFQADDRAGLWTQDFQAVQATTAADGRFALLTRATPGRLLATGNVGARAGLRLRDVDAGDLRVVLSAAGRATIAFESSAGRPRWVRLVGQLEGGFPAIRQCAAAAPEIGMSLPAGDGRYTVTVGFEGGVIATRRLRLRAGKRTAFALPPASWVDVTIEGAAAVGAAGAELSLAWAGRRWRQRITVTESMNARLLVPAQLDCRGTVVGSGPLGDVRLWSGAAGSLPRELDLAALAADVVTIHGLEESVTAEVSFGARTLELRVPAGATVRRTVAAAGETALVRVDGGPRSRVPVEGGALDLGRHLRRRRPVLDGDLARELESRRWSLVPLGGAIAMLGSRSPSPVWCADGLRSTAELLLASPDAAPARRTVRIEAIGPELRISNPDITGSN